MGKENKDGQLIQFQKGMNQDTDKSLVSEGSYHFALNGRLVSLDGDTGAFHNMKGMLSCFKPYDFDYYINNTDALSPLTIPHNPPDLTPATPPDEIQPDINLPLVPGDRVYILGSTEIDDLMFIVGVVYRLNTLTGQEEPYRDFIGLHAPNGVDTKGYKIIKWTNINVATPEFDGYPYATSVDRDPIYLHDGDFTGANCFYQLIYLSDNRFLDSKYPGYKPKTFMNLFRDHRVWCMRAETQFDKSVSLYFTDNYNKPFRYNTNEIYDDPRLFSISLSFRMPFIDVPNDVNDFILPNQGFLPVGSYRIGVRYVTDNFNTTNLSYLSRLIEITPSTDRNQWWSYDGGDSLESPTNKAVRLYISNIDQAYQYIQLVVVYYNETGVTAYADDFIPITGDFMEVIHKGFQKEIIDIADININTLDIKRCRTLDIVENRLFIANIIEQDVDNGLLQGLADLVRLEFTTDKSYLASNPTTAPHAGINYHKKRVGYEFRNNNTNLSSDANPSSLPDPGQRWGHYQNELMVYKYQGLFRDMWESYGLQFVFKDGSKSFIFPIGNWYVNNPGDITNLSSVGGIDYDSFVTGGQLGADRIKAIFREKDSNQNKTLLFKAPVYKLNEDPTNDVSNHPGPDSNGNVSFDLEINPLYLKFDLSNFGSDWDKIKDQIEGFAFYFGTKEDQVLIAQGILYGSMEDNPQSGPVYDNNAGSIAFHWDQALAPNPAYSGYYSENKTMFGVFNNSAGTGNPFGVCAPEYHGGRSNPGDPLTNTHRKACLFAMDLAITGNSPLNGGYCHVIYQNMLVATGQELFAAAGYLKPLLQYEFGVGVFGGSEYMKVQGSTFYCNSDTYYDTVSSNYYDDTSDPYNTGAGTGCKHYRVAVTNSTYYPTFSRTSNFLIWDPLAGGFSLYAKIADNHRWTFSNHIFTHRDQGNPTDPQAWETGITPAVRDNDKHYYYKTVNYITNRPIQTIYNKTWELIDYQPVGEVVNPNATYPAFDPAGIIGTNLYREYPPDSFIQLCYTRLLTVDSKGSATSAMGNTSQELYTGSILGSVTENQYNWELRSLPLGSGAFYYPASNVNLNWYFWANGGVDSAESFNYNQAFSAHNRQQVGFSLPLNFTNIQQFPTRIRYSQLKIVGQKSDSYRIFFANDFRDDDLRYGEIMKILNYFSNIYSCQRQAMNIRPVNMQATQMIQGQSILLGTGSVLLAKPQYITMEFGTQHQGSIVKSNDAIYGIDCRQSEIWRFKGEEFTPLATDKSMYAFVNNWLDSHLPFIARSDNSYTEIPYLFGKARIALHSYYDSLYDDVYFIFTWQLQSSDGIGVVYPDPQLAGSDSRALKFSVRQDAFDSFAFGHPHYPTDLTNIPNVFPNQSSSWVMPDIMMRLGNLVFGYQVLTQYYPLNDSSQDIWRNKAYEMNVGPRAKYFGRFIEFALTVIGNQDFMVTKVWDNIIWNGNIKRSNGMDIQFTQLFFEDINFKTNYQNIFFMKVMDDWQASFVDLIKEEYLKRPERDFNIVIPEDMLYETIAPISGDLLPEQVLGVGDPLPEIQYSEDVSPHLPNLALIDPDAVFIAPDVSAINPINTYDPSVFRERFRDKWVMVSLRFKNSRVVDINETPTNQALDWKYLFRTLILLYRRSFH